MKSKDKIIAFFVMVLFASIFVVVFLAWQGNKPQIFDDVVIGWPARLSMNKTPEIGMTYFLFFAGIVVYTAFYYIKTKMNGLVVDTKSSFEFNTENSIIVTLALITVMSTVMYPTSLCMTATVFLLIGVTFFINKKQILLSLVAFFTFVYAQIGSLCIITRFNAIPALPNFTNVFFIVSFLVCCLFLIIRKTLLKKAILIAQLIVPFTLFVYLINRYEYNGQLFVVPVNKKIVIVVSVLIALFVLEGCFRIKRYWKDNYLNYEFISYGMLVSVMNFNRFSGTGAIMDLDGYHLHHWFENLIGYSQVFELGQKLVSQYFPISGMFSLVYGFFFKIFGNGLYQNYYVVDNLFYLVFIMVVVGLLWKRINKVWIWLISIVFFIHSYNRVVLILPTMLLLTDDRLIKKQSAWLGVWFVTSLIQGLYYPVYGAAVCLGFVPLGIIQIKKVVTNIKSYTKNPLFWIEWCVCGLLFLLALPLLLGALKQTSAMGRQSLLAFGFARFGQSTEPFLSFLSGYPLLQSIIFILFTFIPIVAVLWFSYMMAIDAGNIVIKNKRITILNMQNMALFLSIVIPFLVCNLFTIELTDFLTIYARNTYILLIIMIMYIVFIDNFKIDNYLKILALLLIAFVFPTAGPIGLLKLPEKTYSAYTVPTNYIYIEDYQHRLGSGFVDKAAYDSLLLMERKNASRNKTDSYTAFGNFGHYYCLNQKGDVTLNLFEMNGYDALQEVVTIIRNNNSFVGTFFSPYENYYLYYWLMTSGEYVWIRENNRFEPVFNGMPIQEIRAKNNSNPLAYNGFGLGETANSLGMSIKTLQKIFTEKSMNVQTDNQQNIYEVSFDETNGQDADFLYVEFENLPNVERYYLMTKDKITKAISSKETKKNPLAKQKLNPDMHVTVSWLDDERNNCSINAEMGNGQLLIALGAGYHWLLNKHDRISVTVTKVDPVTGETVEIESPDIAELRFLKLRELQ